MGKTFDFDYTIIGSGFGGSVSAMRLTQKGYKVCVVEMGKEYKNTDFPRTNWNVPKFSWLPLLKCFGFFRMTLFKHIFVLSGTGVGGGSLVYANTLLEPDEKVWNDGQWKNINNWKEIMPAFYNQARHMLGVTQNPFMGDADKVLLKAAQKEGIDNTFYRTDVGVFFGEKGKMEDDPYFNGEGPKRTGCELCGGCMCGCRYDGKNTLDKNYLYFARKNGARIIPEYKVIKVKPVNGCIDGSQGYKLTLKQTTGFLRKRKEIRTQGVIFSGGVLGTLELLLKSKKYGHLPGLSNRVGDIVRTNSESIIGVKIADKTLDMSTGIAIGSGIYTDKDTHIEATRYPAGSDLLSLVTTIMTKGGRGVNRPKELFKLIFKNPLSFFKTFNPLGFARKTIILLCMQAKEGKMSIHLQNSFLPPFKDTLATSIDGEKVPTYIPSANRFAHTITSLFGGTPITSYPEIFLDVPTTAHILGGAVMGEDETCGVIDYRNQVFNYKNMLICDGSMIGANLGVNPALSITAFTEHAMSHIDEKISHQNKGQYQ